MSIYSIHGVFINMIYNEFLNYSAAARVVSSQCINFATLHEAGLRVPIVFSANGVYR